MAASTAVAARQERRPADLMETVLLEGDLSKLSSDERMTYYQRVCESLGLNPLTRPFQYHTFQGKMILYARKDCTEQLRKIHNVSISKPDITQVDDLVVVSVEASLPNGRTDSDAGAVAIKGLTGEARANAVLKAITKAKRRATLSICGLGVLDETEVEDATPQPAPPKLQTVSEPAETAERRRFAERIKSRPDIAAWMEEKGYDVWTCKISWLREQTVKMDAKEADAAIEGHVVERAPEPPADSAPLSPLERLSLIVDRSQVYLESDRSDAREATAIMAEFTATLGPAFVKPATPSAEGIGVAITKNKAKAMAQIEAASQQPVDDDETPF